MIRIFVKAGTIQGHAALVFILDSQKHRWTKAHKITQDLPQNTFTKSILLESVGIMFALKHIKNKNKKKKIIIYIDSKFILSALEHKDDKFTTKTSNLAVKRLRDVVGCFNDLQFENFIDDYAEFKQDLEHIFIECALDNIEIDEKNN